MDNYEEALRNAEMRDRATEEMEETFKKINQMVADYWAATKFRHKRKDK